MQPTVPVCWPCARMRDCRFTTPSAAAREMMDIQEFLRGEVNNEEATRYMTWCVRGPSAARFVKRMMHGLRSVC